MRRVNIPIGRLHRCELAAQESGAGDQAHIDAPCLDTAGDLARAGGAIAVTSRSMLLRAAASSGGDGVAAEINPETKARSAGTLERMGALVAADTVRMAVVFQRATLAQQSAPGRRGAGS